MMISEPVAPELFSCSKDVILESEKGRNGIVAD